jgi:hypothetical protein
MHSATLKFKIPKEKLAAFKYILESYENLATVSTLDPKTMLVKVSIPSGEDKTAREIIKNIAKELNFDIVDEKWE